MSRSYTEMMNLMAVRREELAAMTQGSLGGLKTEQIVKLILFINIDTVLSHGFYQTCH